jgi:hypothetical protein
LPLGDAFADAFDDARNFTAGGERARWLELVFVLDDENVGIVDRARLDRHHDLSRSSDGIGQGIDR